MLPLIVVAAVVLSWRAWTTRPDAQGRHVWDRFSSAQLTALLAPGSSTAPATAANPGRQVVTQVILTKRATSWGRVLAPLAPEALIVVSQPQVDPAVPGGAWYRGVDQSGAPTSFSAGEVLAAGIPDPAGGAGVTWVTDPARVATVRAAV